MFQFTGLIRGPTQVAADIDGVFMFQFTGLIRGPTCVFICSLPLLRSFNSQASYEARPHAKADATRGSMFQFTGLIRGPTIRRCCSFRRGIVSIHRPHTRPDLVSCDSTANYTVSIHRPHTRPDDGSGIDYHNDNGFNSQASYEARLVDPTPFVQSVTFQFTGLIRGPTAKV